MSKQLPIVIPPCSCGGEGIVTRGVHNLSQFVKCAVCGRQGPETFWKTDAIRGWTDEMKKQEKKA